MTDVTKTSVPAAKSQIISSKSKIVLFLTTGYTAGNGHQDNNRGKDSNKNRPGVLTLPQTIQK